MCPASADQQETRELALRFMEVMEQSFRRFARHVPKPTESIFRELNVNQIRALHYLHEKPGSAQKELAEFLEVTPAAISTAMREMEQMRLVERKADEKDARQMQLYLSARAQRMLNEYRNLRSEGVVQLLRALPIEEQRMVVEALERAIRAHDQSEHLT
jgi:DNA-binding MarR family transcriptional regulator